MLRECKFILPMTDRAGISTAEIHRDLQRSLCNRFGGYTMFPVNGGWVNDRGTVETDTSLLYLVACEPKDFRLLRATAKYAGLRAGQSAVYFVADGEVEIVALPKPEVR